MPIIEPPITAILPYEHPAGKPLTTIVVQKLVYNPDSDAVEEQGTETLFIRTAVEQRCRNCKFWNGNGEEGECKKIGHETVEFLAYLSDPSALFTKADFGCIHFEVKDANP